MNKLHEQFFQMIDDSSSIVIFGHVYPDGDCYGSTEGLKYALQEFYPLKKIYVSGTDWRGIPPSFPYADVVSDEVISSSLHIICDLPDKNRIGDRRAFDLPNKGLIKVDHHFFKDDFGGLEIVEDQKASCSDLLASLLYEKFDHLPKMAANCFFLGLTTDSGRFQYFCDEDILNLAGKLIHDGAKPMDIFSSLYQVEEESCLFKGYLLSHYKKTTMGVVYCFVSYEDSLKYKITPHSAALSVNSIGNINSSRLWVCFGEDKDGSVFAEFRSKGNVDVHKVAEEFLGGGHLNASGCTLKSKEDIPTVIKRCEELVYQSFGPYHQELKTLITIGQKAADVIMDIYKKGFKVDIKDDNSPVTTADKASDTLIREALLKQYPTYGLLTEEDADDKKRLSKDKVFIIDPLDGTSDFVIKDDMFCINLALVDHHSPVVGVVMVPPRGDIYFAVKDQGSYVIHKDSIIQRIHVSNSYLNLRVVESVAHQNLKLNQAYINHASQISKITKVGAAIKACLIAEGKADISYTIGCGTKEWDTCAPQLVVLEAGGIYRQNHKGEITYNRDDVYNRDGFTALNREESDIIPMDEIYN